jgi:alkylated DNA repair dioxygenase AlkB
MHPLLNTPDAFLYVGQLPHEDMELVEQCVAYCVPRLEHKPEITVFGRKCNQQRNVGFFSNESIGYQYSSQIMRAQPLSTELEQLMAMVNARFQANYNGILCNEYPDGNHVVGAHSDEESALDKNSGVVAISWGAERTFRIRNKTTKQIVADVAASHGSVIQMGGKRFQREYTHEIPKQTRVKDGRVSFTFRYHLE